MRTVIEKAAPAQILGTIECRDASCGHATSHPEMCTCPCGSAGHGSLLRASFPSTAKRSDLVGGFSRSMLAAISSDEAF